MKIRVGDRVKTPDGRTITVAGVIHLDGPAYLASQCEILHAHQDGVEESAADQAQDQAAGAATREAPAAAGGDTVIWGT